MATPKSETVFEAMASELNPRGNPYSLGDVILTPGEWVEVNERQSYRLSLMPWATVREKKANDGG